MQQAADQEVLLSRDAARAYLGAISMSTLDRLRAAGRIREVHLGRRVLIDLASLRELVATSEKP